jgi:hypothetical protein
MIPWVVIDRRHFTQSRLREGLRHSTPISSSQRLCVRLISRLSSKSLPHNLFVDPHPLNLYASIFYKKAGGRGLPDVQIEAPPGAVERRSPPGRDVPMCFRAISFLFKPLRTLLHSRKTQLLCFQAIPHSLQKTTQGGGLMANQLTPGFNVSTFKRSDVQTFQRVLATPFFPLPKDSSFSATRYVAPIVQRPRTSHHRIARQGEARLAPLAASTWSWIDGSRIRSTPTGSESSLRTLWAH